MASLTQDSTHSSDYFDDDPEFLKAIHEVEIPQCGEAAPSKRIPASPTLDTASEFLEEPPRTQLSRKRLRSPDEFTDENGMQYHGVLNPVDASGDDGEYLQSHTYGAARFGEFGEYMTRKRAKLQIQNAELNEDEETESQRSRIFRGLQIYVRVYAGSSSCPLELMARADQWMDRTVNPGPAEDDY